MDVEEVLRSDAAALSRQIAATYAAFMANGFLLNALKGGTNQLGSAGRCAATGRAPARTVTTDACPEDELIVLRQQAIEDRDPASTRRVAELLELIDRPTEAVEWWNLAAVLGDADAIDYVKYCL